jgi:uncharacterized protein (TIRG00374 family)
VKRRWRLVVGTLISVLAFALILRDVELARVAEILARARYVWLVPSIGFTILAMGVRAYRWRMLLDDRVSLWRAFHVWNAGEFLNNVLPMRIGEVARAYLLGRSRDVGVMQTLSTIAVERLLDLLTVCGFLLVVLPFVPAENVFLRAATVLAAAALVGVLVLFVAAAWRVRLVALAHRLSGWAPPRVRDPLLRHGDEFLRGIQAIGVTRLMVCVPWSIVAWLGWVGADWSLLFAFAPDSTWDVGVFVTCAIALGLTIPSAPSGAGIVEAATVAALASFGVPADVALAYGLTLHLSNFVVVAVAGLWALNLEGQTVARVARSAEQVGG